MVVHCAASHDSWRGQPNQAAATAARETAALDLHKVLEKIQTGHPAIYLYMYINSIFLSIYLLNCIYIYLTFTLSIYLSIDISAHLSIYL